MLSPATLLPRETLGDGSTIKVGRANLRPGDAAPAGGKEGFVATTVLRYRVTGSIPDFGLF